MTDVVSERTREMGDVGTGEPVVLLHAFPLDARMWADCAAILASSWRVVTPNLRGFGRSGAVDVPASIDAYADDVAAWLAERSVASATVVGLSMGGYVALALWRRHPHLVARLGLAGARAESDAPAARVARDENIALVEREGGAALVERMLPKLLGPNAASRTVTAVRAIANEQRPAALRAALAAMRDRSDNTAALQAIAVPTAIIVGADDAVFSPVEAQQLAASIPAAVLEVIDGAGHLAPCEAPQLFAGAVARLLARD